MAYRTQRDSMGEVQVPAEALYGAQTQRAIDNVTISTRAMPAHFIRCLAQIKRAAALAKSSLRPDMMAAVRSRISARSWSGSQPRRLRKRP